MNATLRSEFENPGAAYRGKPFWAWNGRLDPAELQRQIRVMQRMGLGGFFMHSRVGLATPYLSDEWFDCVKACVDQAAGLGMEAWLYDEDRWPSGAAGGLVTLKRPEYRARRLVARELRSAKDFRWEEHTLAAYVAKVEGANATALRRIRKGQAPPKLARGEVILAFHHESEPASSWYNDGAYLDTLNPDAVRDFLAVTHEAYRARFGEEFGKRIPGIFTDEPNHASMVAGEDNWLIAPWTPALPKVFRKRYGYDLADHLPEIFYDVEGRTVSPARYHYHDAVTHLFVEAFAKQIGEWCDKHGLLHTGHVLAEATLSSQTLKVGSCMRFYEYMQAPGMDLLRQDRREYDTAKQVASVARQFNRKWRLTETYGCTGWDFPFAGHKAQGDWQTALGINLRCQHLSWYTMEGQAKRDYPASILHQSPWWRCYPKVEDYYARVLAAMTRGREVRDLLVVHPVESMWMLCKKGWLKAPETEEYDQALVDLRDSLLARNLDFDYGDEDILARHGKVSKQGGVPRLIVGRAKYAAVVVPPLVTIRKSTLRLLQTFQGVGGHVVFAGPPPACVDAKLSVAAQDAARLCEQAPPKGKALADAVEGACRRVSVLDEKGEEIAAALHLLREDNDAYYLFVCNVGYDFARSRRGTTGDLPVRERQAEFPKVSVRITGEGDGKPLGLDPETGEVFAAQGEAVEGGWALETDLPALGSRLFCLPKKKSRTSPPARPRLKQARVLEMDDKEWKFALSESNCFVLDRPRFRIGDRGKRRPAQEILRVDNAVRDALGIPRRGGRMVQPWARKPAENPKGTPIKLYYRFEVKAIPSGDLFLALERPELYRVVINRNVVSVDADCGWWVDRSLRRIRLDPASLNVGDNEISLECQYDENHPGFETIYLLGNFGAAVKDAKATLVEPPATLQLGDWTRQGLPFYSGSVAYVRTLRAKLGRHERAFVQVPDYAGVGVNVLVDGRQAGVVGWAPNEVEITPYLTGQPATLVIEVLGHRRNSHGPLHHAEGSPGWVGPSEFQTEGKLWAEPYQLVPCGLMKPPRLVVRKPE